MIETERIANDPEAQRSIAEQVAAYELDLKRRADDKLEQERWKKRQAKSVARAARTKRRLAKRRAT